MSRFDLTEIQARAILDLRLQRLTQLEAGKIQAEYDELQRKIAELRAILGDERRVYALIREELLEIRGRFADERRTEIVPGEGEIDLEDLIAEEEMVISISNGGYIKRLPVTTYRALYPDYAIAPTVPTPGAVAALAAVRERGLRVVVVTSKIGRLARLHLDHLGMTVDEVAGDLFAEEKATALTEHGVRWYVGDHVADMVAARTAGVPGVGVATGPCSAADLEAAGASHVLPDLTAFPGLLSQIAVGP